MSPSTARAANAARRRGARLSRSRLRAAPGKARTPEPQCLPSQRCGGHHDCASGFGCLGGCCKKGVERNPVATGVDRNPAVVRRMAAPARVRKPKPSPCPKELPFRCRDGTCAKDWTFCSDRITAARPRPGGRPSPQISAPRPGPRGPSGEVCFQACCGVFEPDGTNCKSKDAKVTQPNTWTCILNCLKIPDPNTGGRVQNGCYRPGRPNHPGRAVVACRLPNTGSRLQRRAVARLQNPGPNGEALPVPPFCAAGVCGRLSCGTCNPAAYAVPGAVRTVLEAVAQAQADVDYAVRTASQAERAMYAPGALAWADPSVAILQKPGGPPPGNALPTAEWPHCWGPAAVADPSSNRQPNPGGTR